MTAGGVSGKGSCAVVDDCESDCVRTFTLWSGRGETGCDVVKSRSQLRACSDGASKLQHRFRFEG